MYLQCYSGQKVYSAKSKTESPNTLRKAGVFYNCEKGIFISII